MDLILHDLDEQSFSTLSWLNTHLAFGPTTRLHFCEGCFDCWVKTPGRCKLKDEGYAIPHKLSQAERLIIVTKLFHGGPSPVVKRLIDRCLPFFHPYFAIRNGEMHHKERYPQGFKLVFRFYGSAGPAEKDLALGWAHAMAVNCNTPQPEVHFNENVSDLVMEVAK